MQQLVPHPLLVALFLFHLFFLSPAFNEMERQSLLSLPFNTSSLPLDWSSINYCHWEGISCDKKGMVTHIWLPFRGLTGALPISLGKIKYLSHLNLSHNLLVGVLPRELFSALNQLKVLDLSYNNLFGDITNTLCCLNSIQVLDISSNHFNGTIQSSFLHTTWRLMKLNVSNNSLTGLIPSFPCTNSSFVQLLDFSYNDHVDQIPRGLGACPKLKVFRASFNSLSGVLPQDIYNATKLEELSLSSNSLLGSISSDIVNLAKLTKLELQNNKLSGQIPMKIGKLSKLKYLHLDFNSFIGPLPSSLVNCTYLVVLTLGNNDLEGDISTFNFTSLRQLTMLDMMDNNFFGKLPMSLYNCKSLVALRLSGNRLEGQIVPAVAQLKFLSFLSLSINGLTNIIEAFKNLKHCKYLSVLLLGKDFFGEAIPSDDGIVGFDGFRNIQFLSLAGCQLTGQLPKWLSLLHNLEVLYLGGNKITGSIPMWLSNLPRLFRFDLSENLISGEFPRELCTMLALVSNEALRKRSYMSLPIIGGGHQYNTLSNMKPGIMLSHNQLSGSIPLEIGHLKALHILDLSGNNFSGTIPNQIAELTNLEELDLSSNHFRGEIPTSLVNLNFLSYFNVAYNHLDGQIPSSTQLQSFDVSAYEGNLNLCGPPLPKCAEIVKTNDDKYIQKEEERPYMPWFPISIVLGLIVGFWGVCGSLIFNNKWRVAYFRFVDNLKEWFYVTLVVLFARLSRRS